MDSDLETVQFVRDAQAGSPSGISGLYGLYTGSVWAHIHRRTGGDRSLTDDIHMDVWETVTRKIQSFNPEKGKFVTWLFHIADNRAVSVCRRAGVHRSTRELRAHMLMHGASEASSSPGPEDTAVAMDEARQLLGHLRTLSPRQREAVLLTEFDGLSAPDAAAVLGCSIEALWKARSKALINLRKKYGVINGQDRGALRVKVVVAPHTGVEPAPSRGNAEPSPLEG